jgi:SAM-dependent methyltransferase
MSVFKKHDLLRYVKGRGIEIGALHNPQKVAAAVHVVYVDMLGREGLIDKNPEIPVGTIKSPDIVADAEDLGVIPDGSMDFVIASHILEHVPNPIKAIKEFYRVLKAGGILYVAVPDKRYTFDRERPVTPLAHLIEDYAGSATGPASTAHYREWLDFVELKKDHPVAATLDELMKKDYRIHFHVWVPDSVMELFNYLKNESGLNVSLADFYYRRGEQDSIFVIKKTGTPGKDFPRNLRERYPRIRRALIEAESVLSRCWYYLKRAIKGENDAS